MLLTKKNIHIYFIIVFFTIIMFYTSTIKELFSGLVVLILAKDTLITDYTSLVGVAPTLFNVTLVTLFTLFIMKINKVELNGLIIAGLFTNIGFSFFGKNILNILPVYIGILLYTKYTNQSFKQFFVVALFGTGLAPIVSSSYHLGTKWILFTIFMNIFYGFVLVPLASHIIRFHNGYNLYNIGFTGGLFAMIYTGLAKTFGMSVNIEANISESSSTHNFLLFILITICMYFILFGIYSFRKKKFTIKNYKNLMSMNGRAVTDNYNLFGEYVTFFNMGVIGLIIITVVFMMGVPFNGPITGSIISVIGFGAFGKHPKNIIAPILGCLIIIFLSGSTINTAVLVTLIFVTGLAPIAGEYGFIVGMIAGVLHFSLVRYTAEWQGGFNLYNNGFAAGFIAAFISSIMDNMLDKRLRKNE